MKTLPFIFRSMLTISLLVGSLVGLAVLGVRSVGGLERLELVIYDWLLRSHAGAGRSDPRIVLIAITEDDIQMLRGLPKSDVRLAQSLERRTGYQSHIIGRWPVTDAVLAVALERLIEYQPRAIGVDIYRDMEERPGGEQLNAVLKRYQRIIGVGEVGACGLSRPNSALGAPEQPPAGAAPPPGLLCSGEFRTPPPTILNGTDRVGFTDLILDDPGDVARRGLLFQGSKVHVMMPSFASRVAHEYLKADGISLEPDTKQLQLGSTALAWFEASDGGYAGADADGYQILLDFKHARAEPMTFSFTAFLLDQVPPDAIRDKAVLIGTVAESVPDWVTTPVGENGGRMRGVVLHAQILSQLLRIALDGDRPIGTISDRQEIVGTLLWALLGGMVGLWARSSLRLVVAAAGGLAPLGVAVFVAFGEGLWIPSVAPALAWVLSTSVVTASVLNQEKQQRSLLMQLFSRHVSPEVAEAIWRQRDQFLDDGRPRPQKMVVTVLFTDLKGYTSVAELLAPQALMDWINSYLEAMAQLVIEHGGVIDDYAGDAIKANFGVPIPRMTDEEITQDAARAVGCALAMETALRRINARWQAAGRPTAAMRIGICTGPVVAGSLGSAQRLKYTTVGDTVNSAARLESLDKDRVVQTDSDGPCRILVGETTADYLVNRFRMERLGEVAVKGKERPLIVYRVVGPSETAGRQPRQP